MIRLRPSEPEVLRQRRVVVARCTPMCFRVPAILCAALAALLAAGCGVLNDVDDILSGRFGHDFVVANLHYTPLEVRLTAGDGTSDYRIVKARTESVWSFRDNPNTVRVSASTFGRTASGTRLGLLVEWEASTTDVRNSASATLQLTTGPELFFLRLRNTSGEPLRSISVYENGGHRWDLNVSVPGDGLEYGIGYFRLAAKVTGCFTTSCIEWTGIAHPFEENLVTRLRTDSARPY